MIFAADDMILLPVTEMKIELLRTVFCAVEPLYDWSGRALSVQELQMLRHYQITFRHLVTVYDGFCSCSSTATESGELCC